MQSASTPQQSHRGLDTLLKTSRSMPLDLDIDRFCFLRHGQTDGNRYKFFQPATQPLNERGLAQARLAGETLARHPLKRIVASDMLRTVQTAEAVASATGLAVEPSALLRERNFGNLVGTSSLLIDWTCNPDNGESLEAFVLRVHQGLKENLNTLDTLVVGHGGTLYVLASVLGIDIADAPLTNATPLRFERDQDCWRIEPLQQPGAGEEAALS